MGKVNRLILEVMPPAERGGEGGDVVAVHITITVEISVVTRVPVGLTRNRRLFALDDFGDRRKITRIDHAVVVEVEIEDVVHAAIGFKRTRPQ